MGYCIIISGTIIGGIYQIAVSNWPDLNMGTVFIILLLIANAVAGLVHGEILILARGIIYLFLMPMASSLVILFVAVISPC